MTELEKAIFTCGGLVTLLIISYIHVRGLLFNTATEPSPLPPPPPQHSGPWYLLIEFNDAADCPDLYLKADGIRSIVGDPKTQRLVIMTDAGEQVFNNVWHYTFKRQSQMGDYLWHED